MQPQSQFGKRVPSVLVPSIVSMNPPTSRELSTFSEVVRIFVPDDKNSFTLYNTEAYSPHFFLIPSF